MRKRKDMEIGDVKLPAEGQGEREIVVSLLVSREETCRVA